MFERTGAVVARFATAALAISSAKNEPEQRNAEREANPQRRKGVPRPNSTFRAARRNAHRGSVWPAPRRPYGKRLVTSLGYSAAMKRERKAAEYRNAERAKVRRALASVAA